MLRGDSFLFVLLFSLRNGAILILQHLLHRRPSLHPLHPRSHMWELLLDIFTAVERGPSLPRDEAEIGICALPADQPFAVVLQDGFQNPRDAANLVGVSLNGARNPLRVEFLEPAGLAVVRTLTGGLEMQPHLGQVPFGEGGVAQLVLPVVGVEEIFDNSAGFPEYNAIVVGVLDG